MDFASRIKKLRLERKLTQEQLGKMINVTKVSISGYENGNRSPDMETLQRIADYFDVKLDYLTGRSDDPSPSAKRDENNTNGGRAYYNGGKDWTEEEVEMADAIIKKLREQKRKQEGK